MKKKSSTLLAIPLIVLALCASMNAVAQNQSGPSAARQEVPVNQQLMELKEKIRADEATKKKAEELTRGHARAGSTWEVDCQEDWDLIVRMQKQQPAGVPLKTIQAMGQKCLGVLDEKQRGLRFRTVAVGQYAWLDQWGGLNKQIISERDVDRNSLLHVAAMSSMPGSEAFIKQWQKAGGAIEEPNREGWRPLKLSLGSRNKTGSIAFSKALIEAGANVKALDSDGGTLLHFVASSGTPAQAEILIKDISVLSQTKSGLTPLQVAIAKDNGQMVEWLLKNGAPLQGQGMNPLVYLAINRPDALSVILKMNPKEALRAGQGGQSLLHAAVMSGGRVNGEESPDIKQMIDILIAAKVPVNAKDQRGITPVMLAIAQSKPYALERLLKAGASLCEKDAQGFAAWKMAPSPESAERLKSVGKCPD